jgi:peptidoglycan/xylan/chitin deacetylase (PgdA/CDA1 family)
MTIDFNKLIKGYYEAEKLTDFASDTSVPDFAYNILNKMGLLYEPIVDQAYISENKQTPEWPEGKPFAVCLTHDVDLVSHFSLRQSLRPFRSPFNGLHVSRDKLGRLSRIGFKALQACINQFFRDPLHCYERWLNIEKDFDTKSTFFFWPGWSNVQKHHYTDCQYDLDDRILFDGQKCTVTEMIQEIHRREWEIGLHPSWYTYNDADELKRQKEALEISIGSPIDSVRQHYLHYDIRSTPRAHWEAGFKYDSTLGFNDNIGFRFGTCYPWNLYDFKTTKMLPIVEIPLIIQDVSMLSPKKGLRLNWQAAFDYIVLIAERVKEVGGVLTLLWHSNEIINSEYVGLYKKSLQYLKRQNCWMTTLREVGNWWTQHSKNI